MLTVDTALAQRLEHNDAHGLADYARALQGLGGATQAQFAAIGGGYAVYTAPGWPINRAVGLGMAGPVTAAVLDRIEAFYRGFGLPAQVEICPLTDPSLIELLGQRGYRIVRFLNTLVRPLDPAETFAPAATGIELVEVTGAQAEQWISTAAGVVGDSPTAAEELWVMVARSAFYRPGTRCFLATLHGDRAGAGALAVQDGLATLFSTTTLPAYRQRGIQAALIRARLAAAAAAGCDLAMVLATPGSQSHRNLERLGFRVMYTKTTLAQPTS